MNNELIPPEDRVPDLYIDGQRPSRNRDELPDQQPHYLDTSHRKMIRGFGWLAWIVVLGLTGYMLFNSFNVQQQQRETKITRGEFLQPVFLGKFALGIRQLSDNPGGEQLKKQSQEFADTLNRGTIEQRFCHAIMLNEFKDADVALNAMEKVRRKVSDVAPPLEYDDDQARLESVLTNLFESARADKPVAIEDTDKQFLIEKLPWFGELALNYKTSGSPDRDEFMQRAQTSVALVTGFVCLGILMLILGCVMFFIFSARILSGSLRHRVVDDSRYGPVYIETFAIWFVLFLGVSLAMAMQGNVGMSVASAALCTLLPLSALFWPIFRGVPVNDLLDDLGLRMCNPFVEFAAGVAGYLAMLPLVFVGLIATAICMMLMGMLQPAPAHDFMPTGVPHPLANEAFGGEFLQVAISLLFIASVLAPVTEEIMFRGVLYRNLRDCSSRMARWASIICAALFSSLIFAAIHPQGIAGIPALTTLAFGFCLVRQWRGSLIAPMVMHAIHNTVITCFLLLMM